MCNKSLNYVSYTCYTSSIPFVIQLKAQLLLDDIMVPIICSVDYHRVARQKHTYKETHVLALVGI